MKIKYLSVVRVKNKLVNDYATLFPSHENYIWLGEIPNMRGHCVVANFGLVGYTLASIVIFLD